MWASIFWHCCTNLSFQVILIAIHKQLRATAPYDLAILYCCYGQLPLDFWCNLWSILTPLLLFKNKFRNLSKHICLLAFLFFIEISFIITFHLVSVRLISKFLSIKSNQPAKLKQWNQVFLEQSRSDL
jgi:hypothetical protein